MDELPEKRKLDQNMNAPFEKKQLTDEMRAISILSKSEEDIFNNVSITTISMSCPPDKVGPLIGKKGIVVQEIMRKSSCRIFVDQNFPEGHPRQVQLTGHPKDLGMAIALIALVMEHGPSIISPTPASSRENVVDPMETTDSDFLCPAAKVGALIGSKGSHVLEIYRRTGCKIQVIQEGVPDGVDRRVSFTGNIQQIGEAKNLVNALLNGGSLDGEHSPNNSENPAGLLGGGASLVNTARTQESDIDPEKVRLVIGAKGVTIGEIMKRSGCKIFINQNFPDGQMHKVVYNGTPQQIDVAKYLVETIVQFGMPALYNILNGSDSIVIQEMNIYQNQASKILGSESINRIQSICNVKVNVDSIATTVGIPGFSEPTIRVSIIGKMENVHSAIKMIYQIIGNLTNDPNGMPNVPQPSAVSNIPPPNLEIANPPPQSNFAHPVAPAPGSVSNSMPPAMNSSASPILALGKDGTSGHLESAVSLTDGSQQQVAEIKNDVMGRVVGARSSNIQLIKSKSGANLQVLKSDHSKATTRIVLSGTPASVALAAQMVQEVLVNGTGKLLKMSDAIPKAAGNTPGNHMNGGANDHHLVPPSGDNIPYFGGPGGPNGPMPPLQPNPGHLGGHPGAPHHQMSGPHGGPGGPGNPGHYFHNNNNNNNGLNLYPGDGNNNQVSGTFSLHSW